MPLIKSIYDVNVDCPLTNMSVAYLQEDEVFKADKIFPTIPSPHISGKYYEYDRGSMNKNSAQERSPGTESAGTGFDFSVKDYNMKMYGLHIEIADQIALNREAALLDLGIQAVRALTNAWLINREVRFVNDFMTNPVPGGTWTYTANGNTTASTSFNPTSDTNNQILKWSDANSSPITDVKRAKLTVQLGGGFRPNIMVMSRALFDQLTEHPDIIERINRGQTNGFAKVNEQIIKEAFELEELYILDSMVSTGVKNAAGEDIHEFIAPNNALLAYRANNPGLLTPTAGYNFIWSDFANALNGVKQMYIELRHTTRYEVNFSEAFKVMSKNLGYLFTDMV